MSATLSIYEVLIRPIVLYACEAIALTKSDEKSWYSKGKILRRIYGSKRNEEEKTYERKTNSELRRY